MSKSKISTTVLWQLRMSGGTYVLYSACIICIIWNWLKFSILKQIFKKNKHVNGYIGMITLSRERKWRHNINCDTIPCVQLLFYISVLESVHIHVQTGHENMDNDIYDWPFRPMKRMLYPLCKHLVDRISPNEWIPYCSWKKHTNQMLGNYWMQCRYSRNCRNGDACWKCSTRCNTVRDEMKWGKWGCAGWET